MGWCRSRKSCVLLSLSPFFRTFSPILSVSSLCFHDLPPPSSIRGRATKTFVKTSHLSSFSFLSLFLCIFKQRVRALLPPTRMMVRFIMSCSHAHGAAKFRASGTLFNPSKSGGPLFHRIKKRSNIASQTSDSVWTRHTHESRRISRRLSARTHDNFWEVKWEM